MSAHTLPPGVGLHLAVRQSIRARRLESSRDNPPRFIGDQTADELPDGKTVADPAPRPARTIPAIPGDVVRLGQGREVSDLDGPLLGLGIAALGVVAVLGGIGLAVLL